VVPAPVPARGNTPLTFAEFAEHVVAVARLLDDPGHDLALPVDVLLVHHRALRLANPLLDDLLGGHRGDSPEVVRRRVGLVDEVVGHLLPVEVELVVDDQRVLLLAGLLLDALELVDRALAGLLEQARLEIRRDVEREDAELALVVELDGRMARCAGCLLVRGEKGVLEGGDERPCLDALLPLDRADAFDDLLAHDSRPSSIRLPRTISPTGTCSGAPFTATVTASSSAATSVPRRRFAEAVFSFTVPPIARRKCSGRRSGRSGPGDETSIVQSERYASRTRVTRSQSAKSTPAGLSTYTQNRAGDSSSTASTSTSGRVDSTSGVIAACSSRSLSYVPVAM